MPLLHLEYSANIPDKNIDFQNIFKQLHDNLSASDFCNIEVIKSRITKHDNYYIACGSPNKFFITLSVAVLSGRALAVLEHKGKVLLEILKDSFPKTHALGSKGITIEIREINKDLYFL